MTAVTRVERYESNGVMDRQDAEDANRHLIALATVIAARGQVDESCDHETLLHRARLVRIVQRATQPNVVARAAVPGVERIVLLVENGRRTATIRTPRADVIIDIDRRVVTAEDRGAVSDRVVDIAQFVGRRA